MKEYTTDAIRNVAIAAHANVGKTTLIEAMLYCAGAVHKMGRVEDGTTITDFDPDEIARGTTLAVTPCAAEWRDCKINLLDTPGYEDFYGDLQSAFSVSEAALILIDAERGVEGGTEKVWAIADACDLPTAIVVNRLDNDEADFEKALSTVEEVLGVRPVRLHIPIGSGADFRGVVDLLTMRALIVDGDAKTVSEGDIPDDVAGLVEEAREALIETAAEGDDELTERYLDDGELTDEEIKRGLRAAIGARLAVPALAASAVSGIAAGAILDFVVDSLPSPADRTVDAVAAGEEIELSADPSGPLAAQVFKTTFDPYAGRLSLFRVWSGTLGSEAVVNPTGNATERIAKTHHAHGNELLDAESVVAGDIGAVAKLAETATNDTLTRADQPVILKPMEIIKPTYSLAVYPMTDADDERLSTAIQRLTEEDPTLLVSRDNQTNETILSGLGDLHIAVALEKAKRKFNASARTSPPKIAYRETITKAVEGVEYTHKKQTGGAGQYARVVINVEPLERGEGYEFVDKVFGGAIDQQFRPSVDKGIQQVLKDGAIAGYPLIDVRVTLVDGKTHPVDSKDIAFQTAGREAFKKAVKEAGAVLLEPIMSVEILCPEESMGDVMGDQNGRRGRVMGMDQVSHRQLIRAMVPLAELSRYQTDIKSMTSARGSYAMELDHFEAVPRELAEKIVAENESDE